MEVNRHIVSIHLDQGGAIPLYIQLAQSLGKLIEDRRLVPGEKIPPIRSLARLLHLNSGTVVRALAVLEKEGLIYKHVGRGTFVSPGCGEARFSAPEGEAGPGIAHDFSALYPSPDLFPVSEFQKCLNRALEQLGGQALTYMPGQGFAPLRKELSQFLAGEGITAGAEDILITSGSQQGIDLAVKAMVPYGDIVFVEEPTYTGTLAILKNRGARVTGIPLGSGGLDFVELEKQLQSVKPRLVYVMTTLQNPTGYTYTADQKKRLLQLACEHNFYILEDDYLGLLDYSSRLKEAEPSSPPLKTMDQWDRVILLRTFSKILMPGLRLGFIVAPAIIKKDLVAAKQATDIATSGLFQAALYYYLRDGAWPEHLEMIRGEYFSRYLEALAFLKRHSPPLRFRDPRGGLSFWVRLPGDMDAVRLAVRARDRGVAVAAGASFFSRADSSPWFRLSYAATGIEDLRKGTALLGETIGELLSETGKEKPVSLTPIV